MKRGTKRIIKRSIAFTLAIIFVGAQAPTVKAASTWSGATEITTATETTGQSYTSTTADQNALLINTGNTSTSVKINSPTVTKSGGTSASDDYSFYGYNSAIMVKNKSVATINGGTVNTTAAGANGIFSYGDNGGTTGASGDGTTVNISDTAITTSGDGSGGIMTTYGGITNATDLTVNTTGGSSAPIRTDRGGGTVTVSGGTYTSSGKGSPAIYSTANVSVSNATLTSKASEGICIEGTGSVNLRTGSLTATNNTLNGNAQFYDTVMIYQSQSGDAESGTSSFSMTGGTLTSNKGHVFHITNTTADINLKGVKIYNNDSSNVLLSVCDDGWSGASNIANLTTDAQTLSGDMLVGSNSTLLLNMTGTTTYTGKTSGVITNANGKSISTSIGTVKVDIGSSSEWILTGDCSVTSLTGSGKIKYNGHTITVGGTAYSSGNIGSVTEDTDSSDDDSDSDDSDDSDDDSDDDTTGTGTFTFTNSSITATDVDSDAYSISGDNNTELTIKKSGSYVLTGSCAEGFVKVKASVTGVTLTLNNLTLTSSNSAPILINKENTGTKIVLVGTNTLTDSEDPDTEDTSDDFEGAGIKIKHDGDLTISGSGTLNINASKCKNGIKSGSADSSANEAGTPITIKGGTINIVAANDGINAHSLDITGGTLTMTTGNDGINTDSFLTIENGDSSSIPKLTINASGDGLDSNGTLNIKGGTTEVFSSTSNDDAAFDYGDGSTFTAGGGTAIGVGMSGVAGYPTSGTYVMFGSSGDKNVRMSSGKAASSAISISSGDTIDIKNASGTTIYSTTAKKTADNIVFLDSSLVKDATYTLYLNDTSVATATAEGDGSSGDKTNPTVTAPIAKTVKYTGSALTLVVAGSTNGGTLQYALSSGATTAPSSSDWTTTVPTGTKEGTYYVWYRVVGNDKYNDVGAAYVGDASVITSGTVNVVSVDEAAGTAVVYDDVAGTTKTVSTTIINEGVVYRMYDPNRGEHFYTKDADEMKALVQKGWTHESNADFTVISATYTNAAAVYRLYNPNDGGMHFYTTDSSEAVGLRTLGWKYEGISHYVYNTSASSGTSQYRLYNPNSTNGEHNWTSDTSEWTNLKSLGWRDEGIRWKIK